MASQGELTTRQGEIIATAMELISRKGIQELTIRNLARELGITEPAIYRHFDSKSDILVAMLEHLHADTQSLFAQMQQEGSCLERIRQYYVLRFRRLETNPAGAAVVFSDEAFMNDERLAVMVRALVELALDSTTALLVQARSEGEIPAGHGGNEYTLATLLVGGVRLLVRRWHMDKQAWSLSEHGMKVVDGFLGLLGGS